MEQKYYWNDYAVEHGARAAFITDEIQKVLDKYVETEDVKVLESIMDERPAHVIDVIYKESMRTYNEDDPYGGEGTILNEDGNSFTTAFHTNYGLFDKNKVFWVNDDDLVEMHTGFWSFPITVWKRGSREYGNSRSSNFTYHNFFYPLRNLFSFDEETGLLDNFYQDIDIMGDEDGWYKDLIKALYRVVLPIYWFWKEEKKYSELHIDELLNNIKNDTD
jgi:hypothetical protein